MTPVHRDRRGLVIAVLGAAVGAGVALFALSRTWVVLVENRPAPMTPLRQPRTGAELRPWLPALGLVGLAGAGALVATGGRGRSAVGALLGLCGLGLLTGAGEAIFGRADSGWPFGCAAGGLALLAAGLSAVRRGRTWPTMSSRYERGSRYERSPAGGRDAPGAGPGWPASAQAGGGSGPGRPAEPPPAGGTGADRRAADRKASGSRLAENRPAENRAGPAAAMWDALDRGEDPTAG
jgi:hypothetical protein